jgi:hypothetical protein
MMFCEATQHSSETTQLLENKSVPSFLLSNQKAKEKKVKEGGMRSEQRV